MMTLYPANTVRWRKGEIVIHDSDAKEPKMLMVVIGYSRDGLCKTQYVSREHKRTVWKNEIAFLHEPSQFGINPDWGHQSIVNEVQRNWARVKNWNLKFPENHPVLFVMNDEKTQACGKAYITQEGRGYLPIVGGRDVRLDAILPDTPSLEVWNISWNGKSIVYTGKKSNQQGEAL